MDGLDCVAPDTTSRSAECLAKQPFGRFRVTQRRKQEVKGQFPGRKPAHRPPPKVNEFAEYLERRWAEGCHNASRLYREIRQKGYKGKRSMVACFVAGWRAPGKSTRCRAPEKIAPKHAAILVTRAADLITTAQQELLARIMLQCPEVYDLRDIALAFRAALKADDAGPLLQWIHKAKHCRSAL